MVLIQWSDRYSVGVPSLDTQHRQLIGIVNELNDASSNADGKEVQAKIVRRLEQNSTTHLEAEEGILRKQGYPAFVQHKAQHDDYLKKIREFEEQLKSGDVQPIALLAYLKDWWTQHILNSDRSYKPFLKGRGIS